MTAKAKAIVAAFEPETFARRDRMAAFLKKSTRAQRRQIMIGAGILTKKGNLTSRYRDLPSLLRQSGAEPSRLLCPKR